MRRGVGLVSIENTKEVSVVIINDASIERAHGLTFGAPKLTYQMSSCF